MSLITIDQLLESVDLNFEPRWVTKDMDGTTNVWENKPLHMDGYYGHAYGEVGDFGKLKLSEFDGKDWTECIYEVPRKTTGKIEKLPEFDRTEASIFHAERLYSVVNELVGYVNALIESNNIHEKQIDELQMKLEPEKCAVNELKGGEE